VATAAFAVDQTTVRPVMAFMAESRATAVNVWVAPMLSDALEGESSTVLTVTGAMTVTTAVALRPEADTVTVEVPKAIPVTTPAALTVATLGLEELQLTAGAEIPASASTVAVSATVLPAGSETVAGWTARLRTPSAVSVTLPRAVPTLAEMVALPRDSAVTCPALDTENTAPSEDAHVGVTPVTGVPRALMRAVNCCDAPTTTDDVGAVTSTTSGTATAMPSVLLHALRPSVIPMARQTVPRSERMGCDS
jgi:hypothetical protein